MKSLKIVVLFLSKISATTCISQHFGLVCPRLLNGCPTSLMSI